MIIFSHSWLTNKSAVFAAHKPHNVHSLYGRLKNLFPQRPCCTLQSKLKCTQNSFADTQISNAAEICWAESATCKPQVGRVASCRGNWISWAKFEAKFTEPVFKLFLVRTCRALNHLLSCQVDNCQISHFPFTNSLAFWVLLDTYFITVHSYW